LEGRLTGCELFLYIDNQVAEGAYYRGTAVNLLLFELVVEIYVLQMKCDIILHVIWIAGTQMIQQSADYLSRGGGAGLATQGLSMMSEVPLNIGALERNALLEPWIRSWAGEEGLVTITPEDWFSDDHARGTFLWTRPPVAAADQLCDVVRKSPCCLHVFMCPLIMTQLFKKGVVEGLHFMFEC
jgi:hypothetical protein